MAATLPLLVSAPKTHYSPLTLLFSVTRSPRNPSFLFNPPPWRRPLLFSFLLHEARETLALFNPPPLRRRRFSRNLSAASPLTLLFSVTRSPRNPIQSAASETPSFWSKSVRGCD
ncbi:hypothetical protein Ddye_011195 [Dipteronia dyeriana]|uniref:Uncharacterized protein n=1 Tax=Dipteronia dyeriana TaxID=168575 RepID=A0AAD9UBV2_9ROSI|nr:hypothetical protein Ddye_011195 [Dipteronia dyeriana]